MKIITLYLIISFCFSIAIKANSNNLVVNKYIYNVDAFTYAAIEYLGIENIMVGIVKLPSKYSAKAIVQHCSENTYSIYVNPGLRYSSALIAIAHELVHIKQSREGRLDINLGTSRLKQDGTFTYKNIISAKLEREAKKLSYDIYYALRKENSY